jgi:hypothetical protein
VTAVARYATQRTDRLSLGHEVAAIAAQLRQPLMSWQREVADVALELLPGTKIPAYREVIVTVPRQTGKSSLLACIEIQRCLRWPGAPHVAYSAQTGTDARRKLLDDQVPLLKSSPLWATVAAVHRAGGREAVIFKNGGRIDVFASNEGAGHGRTIDLAVLDEAFDDEDDRREGAMTPAMATRPAAQLFVVSTAGSEGSAYLKRKVDTGRDAAVNGITEGTAYFEWSAEPEDDIDDPATWYRANPALGHTISEETIRHERSTMTEGSFRRMALNMWTVSEERVIPAAVWAAVSAAEAAPRGALAIGIDVNPERTHASIVIGDRDGNLELVEHTGQGDPVREGIAWVVPRATELAKKWNARVALDARGPAGLFAADLTAEYIEVTAYTAQEMTYACAAAFDAIMDAKVSIRPHAALDAAAAAVTRRQAQDAWVWGRRGTGVDVSPIVALTLAFDLAHRRSVDDDAWVIVG